MSATDAVVSFDDNGNGSLVIEGPSTIPRAIGDVIERLIGSNGRPLHVEVTVTRRSGEIARSRGWATIRIDDDGDGLPELDVQAVQKGFETPLRHAEGLELWCLKWAVRRADGELDTDPADGTLEVRLPIADG